MLPRVATGNRGVERRRRHDLKKPMLLKKTTRSLLMNSPVTLTRATAKNQRWWETSFSRVAAEDEPRQQVGEVSR
jgi:hypothetical protein